MNTYIVTIKVEIDVPQHEDALEAQQELTTLITGRVIKDINYVSKISSKLTEK
jgi:riboflavin synthase